MNDNLKNILQTFGIVEPYNVKQIGEKNVWLINERFVLKQTKSRKIACKVLSIINRLEVQCVPVFHYIRPNHQMSAHCDISRYLLMNRVGGVQLEFCIIPSNRIQSIAESIGKDVALLHKALRNIELEFEYEIGDLMLEFSRSLKTIEAFSVSLPVEIVEFCSDFIAICPSLPRQLIHRDLQFCNLLFCNDELTAFLDFDSCEVNIRLFDLAYLGLRILALNIEQVETICNRWHIFFNFFLKGYHSASNLEKSEVGALYGLILILQICFIAYFLEIGVDGTQISSQVCLLKWIYYNKKYFEFSL